MVPNLLSAPYMISQMYHLVLRGRYPTRSGNRSALRMRASFPLGQFRGEQSLNLRLEAAYQHTFPGSRTSLLFSLTSKCAPLLDCFATNPYSRRAPTHIERSRFVLKKEPKFAKMVQFSDLPSLLTSCSGRKIKKIPGLGRHLIKGHRF